MLVKDIQKCRYFTAGDGSILCELLHPLREEEIALNCSIAHARLPAGQSTVPHRLKGSAEVYYILEGKGTIHVNGKSAEVLPGRAVYIPPEQYSIW